MPKIKKFIINDYGQLVFIKKKTVRPWYKVVARLKTNGQLPVGSSSGALCANERTPHAFDTCDIDPDWEWR